MRTVLAIALLLTFAGATPVAAQTTNAPSGNSGLSQYLEVVPSSSGNAPSKGGKPKKALSAADQAALARRGAVASSLADFASKTAPSARRSGSVEDVDFNGRAAAVASSLGGGNEAGGMGIWLPILMTAVAALALLAGKLRRGPAEQS